MKTLIFASLLAVTSVSALAQSGNGETWGHNPPTTGEAKTRVEVLAELRKAKANNSIAYGEHSSKQSRFPQTATHLTRSDVLMEVAELRSAGDLYINGETGSYHP